jgi:hypothetical protein
MEAMCAALKSLDAEFKDIQLPELEGCGINEDDEMTPLEEGGETGAKDQKSS